MKLTKWNLGIGIVLATMLTYSCNVVTGGSDNKSKNTTIAGLAVLALSQRSSSGRAALVMPDCGKGFYTGETFSDMSRFYTLTFGNASLPGCIPKSISVSTTTATVTYNSNRQPTAYTTTLGSSYTFSYNSLNYLTNQTRACGTNTGNETSDFSYDTSGRLIKGTTTTPAGCTSTGSSAVSVVSDYTYSGNELYPSTLTTNYNSGVCKQTSTITITKNSQGWIATEATTNSSTGTATVSSCTPGQTSQTTKTYTYDTSGNALTIVFTSSSVLTTTSTYDSSSRVSSSNSTSSSGFNNNITYTYNSAGQLTSSVNGSTTTTYSY